MRQKGWQGRLVAYLDMAGRRPFVPGQHDCALFTAGAVAAMTGIDYAADYRGRYTTTRGGLRVLRRDGFADHVALAAAHFPATGQPVPGDLAAVDSAEGPALGVVQGEFVYLLAPGGMTLAPIAAASRFFRVI
jgi:hypothetical protein